MLWARVPIFNGTMRLFISLGSILALLLIIRNKPASFFYGVHRVIGRRASFGAPDHRFSDAEAAKKNCVLLFFLSLGVETGGVECDAAGGFSHYAFSRMEAPFPKYRENEYPLPLFLWSGAFFCTFHNFFIASLWLKRGNGFLKSFFFQICWIYLIYYIHG